MYRENAERADLSPYEYGRMFQSWLSGKVFASQSELARTVGLAQPTVSAYVAIANYPEALIQAFGDPRQIAMRWWQPLAHALKEDKARVLLLAGEIAAVRPPPTADEVFKRLTAPKTTAKKSSSASHEESVKIKGNLARSRALPCTVRPSFISALITDHPRSPDGIISALIIRAGAPPDPPASHDHEGRFIRPSVVLGSPNSQGGPTMSP